MALASCTAQIACLSAESSFGTSVLMHHDYHIKYLVSKKFKTKFEMYERKKMYYTMHILGTGKHF
jgi:hypothetical protein